MDGIAGFPSFACPLASPVPPVMIRRCGGWEENSKIVIVFICVARATEVCDECHFAILEDEKS